MTLYYILFQFKDPDKLPARQKLKLSPLLLRNIGALRSAAAKMEEAGPEAEVWLTEQTMKFHERLGASGGLKEAYQLYNRYDRMSALLTFVFIGDWTYEEANEHIGQLHDFVLEVTGKYFARGGLKITDRQLNDVLEIIAPVEVHKALPFGEALQANLAAAKRRIERESKAQTARVG